jgi:CRP-like cAMP-binding protein
VVRLLEESEELTRALGPELAASARPKVLALVEPLAEGPWTPPVPDAPHAWLGLYVLDGLLAREIELLGISCTELLGTGDLLRPWDHDGHDAPVPASVHWEVLQPARVAALDRRFVAMAARWPELIAALSSSALQRSRWLSLQLAVRCLSGVDVRLLVLLWHMADRWGRVGPDGVVLPLRLTHAQLGRLVAAQRASVTRALARLRGQGFVVRLGDGGWLLHAEALVALPELTRRSVEAPSQEGVLERLRTRGREAADT